MATLNAMFKLFDGYSNTVNAITRKTDQAIDSIVNASGATDKFNNKLKNTGSSANGAISGLTKFLSITALIAGAVKGISIADDFSNLSARLNLINDGAQSQIELQDKIFQAANRSRGGYNAMAGAVAKLGLVAKDTFSSNDETIAFTELIQKSFKVGGASGEEQSSAMLQLSQAMGSGILQGDEFRSISENAPLILEAVAKYTGKARGELKQMSTDGLITSDIIKNSIFAMADEVNAQFETIPLTFTDIMTKLKNETQNASRTMMDMFNNMINSETFAQIVDFIIIGINLIAEGVGWLVGFITDNWGIIEPILMAIGLYLAVVGAMGLASGLMMAVGWAIANAPMLLIIATIAAVIWSLGEMGVTVEDVFGFIGGFIGATIAVIWNLFFGLGELILGIINYLTNGFVDFVNFLANIFVNPISSIIYLFQGMGDGVLSVLQSIAKAMDFIFGSNMGETIAGWRGGLKDMADAAVSKYAPDENYQEVLSKVDYSMESFGLERMNVDEAWQSGSDKGKDVYKGLESGLSNLTDSMTGIGDGGVGGLGSFGTANTPTKVKGEGKNGKVNVDMSDEDLGYLRDIAERDYINKFSTATLAPNIKVEFTGDIKETADVDQVVGRIRKIMQEEIAMTAEGVN